MTLWVPSNCIILLSIYGYVLPEVVCFCMPVPKNDKWGTFFEEFSFGHLAGHCEDNCRPFPTFL